MSILSKVLLTEPENKAKNRLAATVSTEQWVLKPVLFEFLFLELLVPGHHFQPDVLTTCLDGKSFCFSQELVC